MKSQKKRYWYDVVVAPFETIAVMCEQIAERGWSVVHVFNTGAMAKMTGLIMAPGAPEQATALIAAICRIERTGDKKPDIFPPEMMSRNKIRLVDGKPAEQVKEAADDTTQYRS